MLENGLDSLLVPDWRTAELKQRRFQSQIPATAGANGVGLSPAVDGLRSSREVCRWDFSRNGDALNDRRSSPPPILAASDSAAKTPITLVTRCADLERWQRPLLAIRQPSECKPTRHSEAADYATQHDPVKRPTLLKRRAATRVRQMAVFHGVGAVHSRPIMPRSACLCIQQ